MPVGRQGQDAIIFAHTHTKKEQMGFFLKQHTQVVSPLPVGFPPAGEIQFSKDGLKCKFLPRVDFFLQARI